MISVMKEFTEHLPRQTLTLWLMTMTNTILFIQDYVDLISELQEMTHCFHTYPILYGQDVFHCLT